MIAALVSVVLSVPIMASAVVPKEPNESPAGVNEVTRLLDDPCWRIRLWSADVLGQITPPATQAADALRVRADDPAEQPLVRSFALKALAKMGTSANTIVPDLPCLMADPNWLVRQSAEETAENVGRGSREEMLKTLPDVQRLLKDNANATTSFDHFALGPTPELLGTVPQLIALLGDPRYDVRRLGATALGGVGWALRETVNSGQEFLDGIANAAKPLDPKEKATVSDRVATARTLLEQTEAALAVELCDGEPAVRVAAVDALRRMLREKAAPRLIEKLSVEGHPGVQRAIAAALGSIGAETKTTKVVAPIEAALVDLVARGDGLTRESAVVALGQIVPGTDSGTAKLREVLLVDPDTRVKTAAYEALQVRSPHSAGM